MQSFAVNNSYQAREEKTESQSNTKILALIWSSVVGAVLLTSTVPSPIWLPAMIIALGILLSTIVTRKPSAKVKPKTTKADDFSHASACIWQLDREA